MCLLVCVGVALADSNVNMDAFIGQRNLLQDLPEDLEPKRTESTPERKVEKVEEPVELSKGPTRFYFENGKLPKLLLEVRDGIVITVFKNGDLWDSFVLNQEATGGVTGSKVNPDTDVFQVDIDWKKQTFKGLANPDNTINGLQIEMKFDIVKKSFKLVDLKIVNLAVQGKFESVDLHVKTVHGYEVSSPLGLSFGCLQPGMFGPKLGNHTEASVSAGLTFPDISLQVYKVTNGKFGPYWECGTLISIGLWVCILVTLGFAMICTWGFTMLANINTMDRFDDPKGKSIYVPQTD